MARVDSQAILLCKRGLRRGFLTLGRERGWGGSLGALTGVVMLVELFLVAWMGVIGLETMLRTQADLRVQVRSGATDRQVQEFMIAARALPFISHTSLITREQALERERMANPDLVRSLEQANIQNPFPDTVSITLLNFSDADALSAFVKEQQWQSIIDPASLLQTAAERSRLQDMLDLASTGRIVAILLVSLTAAILFFVVVELVRRRAFLRKEEVFVERMSGAQEASVVLPFATEASVLMVLALVIGLACLTLFLLALPSIVPALADDGVFAALRDQTGALLMRYGPVLIVLQFLLIPVMGFGGAVLGTRGGRVGLMVG